MKAFRSHSLFMKIIIILLIVAGCITAFFIKNSSRANAAMVPVADTVQVSMMAEKARHYLQKPGSETIDLDSSESIAKQIVAFAKQKKNERAKGIGYLVMAETYREKGNTDECKKVSRQALQILSKYGTKEEHAKALIEVGGTFDNRQAELPDKIDYYLKGAAIFHEIKDYKSEAGIREFIGDLYGLNQQHKESLEQLNEAVALYKKIGETRLHGVYNLIGSAYRQLGDYPLSLQYNILAVKTGEQLKDSSILMASIYNRLGQAYFETRNYDVALDYFNKGLQVGEKQHDTTTIMMMRINISEALRGKGDVKEALQMLQKADSGVVFTDPNDILDISLIYLRTYMALDDNKNGQLYYNKMVSLANAPNVYPVIRQNNRLAIVSFLQREKKFAESAPYLKAFNDEENGNTTAPKTKYSSFHLQSYRVDSAAGNYKSAMEHLLLYKSISDSLYNINKSKQFAQLQLQFETEKKDENIQLLTQKNTLQNAVIEKEKLTRNITIGTLALLILVLIMGYNRYRLKQQSNARLEAKQNEINEQNELLKKLVNEKEWLLREIHHRVKNNLQIVISLLNTQSAYLDNEEAVKAIQNSQHRMHAMSLIHQKLYQSDNMACIDMSWYVQELTGYIKDCFDANRRLSFKIETDPIVLDVVQAVPLSLILNESITNAIKYAFPDGRRGEIKISMKWVTTGTCQLIVADNGVGLPEGFDITQTSSLGMNLLYGLSDQVGGDMQLESDSGTRLTITFKVNTQLANTQAA